MTNHEANAGPQHTLPAGEDRELGRELSETRGEFRAFKWACGLAFVAIVGTMAFFYNALATFHEGQKQTRESLGAIYQQTVEVGERLDRQGERFEQMDGRLRGVEHGLIEINGRLDKVDHRLGEMEGRLDNMDGRLRGMDGRLNRMEAWREQTDGRLGNVEELLRVLVARSADAP